MLKTKSSKTSEKKKDSFKVQDLNYFTVELPVDLDPLDAEKIRLSLAEEITVVISDVQKRHPKVPLTFKYGFYTGTGMFEVPLNG